jgi:hypothetical protein
MIVALTCVTVAVLLGWPVRFVGADSPRLSPGPMFESVPTIPVGCVEHVPLLEGAVDFADDYHCAGIAIDYHADGVASSPSPMWAGQWLFRDGGGALRRGSCTFNRGIHPTISTTATRATQTFPNDPSGAKSAYLTWRYGETADDVTAAGLWAVFHYYAQDAAGTNRDTDPSSPLVPSLDRVQSATGRADVAARALALDAEATRYSGGFTIDVQIATDGRGEADIMAGTTPVNDVPVTLAALDGAFPDGSTSMSVRTDASGAATFVLIGGSAERVSVTASAEAPAAAQVYRGVPADPGAAFGQTLITGGGSTTLMAQASGALIAPTTTPDAIETSTTETSTTAPATTAPVTTPPTTTPPPTSIVESLPPTNVPPSAPVPVADNPVRPLPVTGRTAIGISYWATAMVVAGFGIVGVLRRRRLDA